MTDFVPNKRNLEEFLFPPEKLFQLVHPYSNRYFSMLKMKPTKIVCQNTLKFDLSA